MTIKFLVLMFAVVLANQVSAVPEWNLGSPLSRLIEFAKQVLKYVHKLIDIAFEQAEETLKQLLDGLDGFKQKALNFAEKEIQLESKILTKLIETIISRSKRGNIDILTCVESVEAEAAVVQKKAINESLTCIDSSIKSSSVNILGILEDLRQINNDFATHDAKLDDCKGQLVPFQCIINVVDDLGKIALSVPPQIKADADKALQDFTTMGFEIFQCLKAATESLQDDNVQLFNDFCQCVYEKEHPEQKII